MKKVVVFGALGHIGAYTIDYLRNKLNEDIFEIIASGRRQTDFYQEDGIDFVQVDICNKDDFKKLPQNDVCAVVNLAGIMPAAMKGYDPYPYIDVNIRGSLNVLEYCRKIGCKRIIITTTEADLSGYWKPGAVIEADGVPKFDYGSNYAMYIISRRTVIDMMENYRIKYGFEPFIIRCSTVYCYTESPYMYKQGKRIIPGYIQIYQKAESGEDIQIWGNPNVKTDIVYVKDFAQIVEKAILAKGSLCGIYNFGTEMPVTLEEQVRLAVDIFGKEGKKSKVSYLPNMPSGRDFVMDISKTKNNLDYIPRYDYRSYLEDYKVEKQKNRFKGLFTSRSKE